MGEVTLLLKASRAGDTEARARLFQLVYRELQAIARKRLGQQETLTQLDAPSLVHEAFLRLSRLPGIPGADRQEFFAYAASVMRTVIVDHVRARHAEKRGGDYTRITLTGDVLEVGDTGSGGGPDIEALDAALTELEQLDDRLHRIVEMRYFAGLTIESIASVMELSPATVKRDWQKARAFLFERLNTT